MNTNENIDKLCVAQQFLKPLLAEVWNQFNSSSEFAKNKVTFEQVLDAVKACKILMTIDFIPTENTNKCSEWSTTTNTTYELDSKITIVNDKPIDFDRCFRIKKNLINEIFELYKVINTMTKLLENKLNIETKQKNLSTGKLPYFLSTNSKLLSVCNSKLYGGEQNIVDVDNIEFNEELRKMQNIPLILRQLRNILIQVNEYDPLLKNNENEDIDNTNYNVTNIMKILNMSYYDNKENLVEKRKCCCKLSPLHMHVKLNDIPIVLKLNEDCKKYTENVDQSPDTIELELIQECKTKTNFAKISVCTLKDSYSQGVNKVSNYSNIYYGGKENRKDSSKPKLNISKERRHSFNLRQMSHANLIHKNSKNTSSSKSDLNVSQNHFNNNTVFHCHNKDMLNNPFTLHIPYQRTPPLGNLDRSLHFLCEDTIEKQRNYFKNCWDSRLPFFKWKCIAHHNTTSLKNKVDIDLYSLKKRIALQNKISCSNSIPYTASCRSMPSSKLTINE